MHKQLEKEAPTVEQAKELIASELGIDEEHIVFEVLRQPQKKTFGLFGGANALVRGEADIPEEPKAEEPESYLQAILDAMGAKVTVTRKPTEGGMELSIEGDDVGFIIGRRGDTLDALQVLAGLHVNRTGGSFRRVTVNVGDYREKREQALKGLAHKMANEAVRTGRRNSLEPMNPYERRLIHTAVQDVPGATSWSVGSEPNRHVVIGPAEGTSRKPRHKGKGMSRPSAETEESRGSNERPRRERPRDSEYEITPPARTVRQFVPRSHPLPVAQDVSPTEKTPSEAESSAVLYGRIDLEHRKTEEEE